MLNRIFHYYWIFLLISLCVIVPGLISLARYGVRPSIDFTGGSLTEIEFSKTVPNQEEVQKYLPNVEISSYQKSGENSLIIRTKSISNEQKDSFIQAIKADFPDAKERRFESVGPVLGKELLIKTLIAVAIVSVVITLYIMYQFNELKYGISAVLAMFHDTLVLFTAFSFLGHYKGVEVDQLFVTAVLTTLSFSVHDTIVFFDRIREMRKKKDPRSLKSQVNTAVLQTMGRSINNSMTIIIMLLALVLLGGESIRWFAVALLVGAVTGTYSSTFTAVPLLLLWEDIQTWRKKKTIDLKKKS